MIVAVRQFPPVGTQQRKHRVGQRSQSHVYLVAFSLLGLETEEVYIVSFQPASTIAVTSMLVALSGLSPWSSLSNGSVAYPWVR